MKNKLILNFGFLLMFNLSFGQIQTDSLNGTSLFSQVEAEKYKTDVYKSDFIKEFSTKRNQEDFKKLRTYLKRKNELRLSLEVFYSKNKRRYFYNKESYQARKRAYLRRIANKIDTTILRGIYFADEGYYYDSSEDRISVETMKSEIIPALDSIIKKYSKIDRENETLLKNISSINDDIILCEEQIDEALTPTYQRQEFRRNVSMWFTLLIAFILIGFFGIIYLKSDKSIGKDFLGENGLQFITLFVLIIAVILFGILEVLEATELAAILSGISGYILGKGINQSGINNVGNTTTK